MIVRYVLTLVICGIGLTVWSQPKPNVNTDPYPLGNPVITHMYTADAAPHVMPDGRVWMVTSVDHEDGGGYSTMHKYHTFSSTDMVHWIDHGEVLNVWEVLGQDKEPEHENWALWAPDMIYHQGKYYLYFPIRIQHSDRFRPNGTKLVTSYIAVAESDHPAQRFTVINSKIEGTKGIDPSIFIDDDGEKYLYHGSHWGAKLKDNMMELDGKPIRMGVDDKDFMEAIWMNKRDGKYYVSYHRHYGKPIDPKNPDDPNREKSRVDYGISDSPLGPFTYQGILNYELGVNVKNGPRMEGQDFVPWRVYQSNHGGIVEYHGKEYLFYHTSALSSWRQDAFQGPGTWTQRSVCIDELIYDEDGKIIPVQQTIEGVGPVLVDQPFSISLSPGQVEATGAVEMTFNHYAIHQSGALTFPDINLGTGYYYFGIDIEHCKGRGQIEVRKDSADGALLGTIVLDPMSAHNNEGRAETFLRHANGKHDIVLLIQMEEGQQLQIRNPHFFAGKPKEMPNIR